jgi:hypothetical protein
VIIHSRKCRDQNCNRLIIWSEQDKAFVNVDDRQLHKLSCGWMPNNGNNNKTKPAAELVLVSSNDFIQAVHNIDQQFKSTQKSIATVTYLTMELMAKIDSILRG